MSSNNVVFPTEVAGRAARVPGEELAEVCRFEAYKKAIVDRYPAYGGAFLVDIANRYFFGTGH